jgi:hypothetical protein
MLILTCRDEEIVHCQQMSRRRESTLCPTFAKRVDLAAWIKMLPCLAVHRSGVGFFGEAFPIEIAGKTSPRTADGECALIPVVQQGAVSIFLYVSSPEENFPVFRPNTIWRCYLGQPPPITRQGWTTATERVVRISSHAESQAGIFQREPMPALIDCRHRRFAAIARSWSPRRWTCSTTPVSTSRDVEAVIEKDQSLVSKLIRVSNSRIVWWKESSRVIAAGPDPAGGQNR